MGFDGGSSPLTRGRPGAGAFIAAMAGAHPRSRGVDRDGAIRSASIGGSSPLTRGRPTIPMMLVCGERLIPAHAGSTSLASGPFQEVRAHPRSRGVDVVVGVE